MTRQSNASPDRIGTVVELVRYPVKSMAGEVVSTAKVDWPGIEGDRLYAFYRHAEKGRFPWVTGRGWSKMVLHRPQFRDPAAPKSSLLDVIAPDGACLELGGDTLLARLTEAAGEVIGLIQVGRGTYDAMPISLASTTTFADVDAAHGTPLDRRRFRTNIVIDSPVSEQSWRGKRLGFGARKDRAELLVAGPIERCVMITIDPETAARDERVMKTIARHFDNRIGVYASPAVRGPIKVGDAVMVLD